MKSFVTGSRAYGTPTEESDIDLVVLLESEDCFALIAQAEMNHGPLNGSGGPNDVSLRFGKLNLICLDDPEKFDLWKQATDVLKSRKPVTREEAVAYHREHVDAAIAQRRRQPDPNVATP